jgi:hypothetical protein
LWHCEELQPNIQLLFCFMLLLTKWVNLRLENNSIRLCTGWKRKTKSRH